MSDGDKTPLEPEQEAVEIDPSQASEELLQSLEGVALPTAQRKDDARPDSAAMADLLSSVSATETEEISDESGQEVLSDEATSDEATADQEVEGADATEATEDQSGPDPSDENTEPEASWLPDGTPLAEDVDVEVIRARISDEIAGLEGEVDEPPPPVIDWDRTELRQAVEALLLVATKPLSIEAFEKCLPGLKAAYIRGFLSGLAERFEHERRGWQLRRVGKGWQLLTRPELHPWVRQLDRKELPERLSRSAMETLAIVAYKQPITRGEIEDIRGVQCGPMLRQLMDMKLVQVLGRNDEAVGRPLIYGTSSVFLDRFGLGSLADLPRRHEFG